MADARATIVPQLDNVLRTSNRRDFLRLAGMGGVGIFFPAVIAGCDREPTSPFESVEIDLATDRGAMNYLYALEQLQLAFYVRVTGTRFVGMTAAELTAFTAILAHETAHRDFYRRGIRSGRITDGIQFDFGSIDFSSRSSVMPAARLIEDLGVAAYNDAGRLFSDPSNLLIASKILAVEARHASAIREFIFLSGGVMAEYFAGDDVIDSRGLDRAKTPAEFAVESDVFFVTKLETRGA